MTSTAYDTTPAAQPSLTTLGFDAERALRTRASAVQQRFIDFSFEVRWSPCADISGFVPQLRTKKFGTIRFVTAE